MHLRTPTSLRIILLGFAAAALVAESAAARTASTSTCRAKKGEDVVARSQRAVVLVRERQDEDGDQATLIGCSQRSNHRRIIMTARYWYLKVRSVQITGTTVAYLVLRGDRETVVATLYRDDALHSGARRALSSGSFDEMQLGPNGTVAAIKSRGSGGQALIIWGRAGAVARVVDGGLGLRRLRFTGSRLSWIHATARKSMTTTLRDKCTAGQWGTDLVDITTTADTVTACWRASGMARSVSGLAVNGVDTSGPWVAISTQDGTIIRRNVVTGDADTIAALGVSGVAVNAQGSVAWTAPTPGGLGGTDVWAHDRGGTRLLATRTDTIEIGFDGATVIWSGRKGARLTP